MSKNRKSRAKHFTKEQIQKFQMDSNIRYVDDHTLRFTYEFRIKLYEAFEQENLPVPDGASDGKETLHE